MELRRLTTVYDPAEDRIRLSGIGTDGRTVALWLTQRLLNRLVPPLCKGLEQQAPQRQGPAQPVRSHIEQTFAQQKAKAEIPTQRPVVPPADAPEWRVEAVDVKHYPAGARLTLKGTAASNQAVLPLTTSAMRQWLGIVHEQYRRAGWPTDAWPAWMDEASAPATRPAAGSLH